jgi:hypothetical protein
MCSTPNHKRLSLQDLKSKLLVIRNSVKDKLARNIFSHFTDHSVSHSDRLCEYVDEMTAPNSNTDNKLSDNEAFILYAACYLHDIGLQNQNVENTQTLNEALSEEGLNLIEWGQLPLKEKQELIRRYHHKFSSEMVRNSVRNKNPIIGEYLNEKHYPSKIACLCEAHCLDTGSERYQELVIQSNGIRMDLLSALLRIADILDESRRRVDIDITQIASLDQESQMHWWRHHYISDVVFDIHNYEITLWQDFPVGRRDEYRDIFGELQIKEIEKEMSRQQSVLYKGGIAWSLKTAEVPEVQSDSREAPDDVLKHILARTEAKKYKENEASQQALLKSLKYQRPIIKQELDKLYDPDCTLSNNEKLEKAMELSSFLESIGGKRDSWNILNEHYKKLKDVSEKLIVIKASLQLAKMMNNDSYSYMAYQVLRDIEDDIKLLDKSNLTKLEWYSLFTECLLQQYNIKEYKIYFETLLDLIESNSDKSVLQARYSEVMMLHGDI